MIAASGAAASSQYLWILSAVPGIGSGNILGDGGGNKRVELWRLQPLAVGKPKLRLFLSPGIVVQPGLEGCLNKSITFFGKTKGGTTFFLISERVSFFLISERVFLPPPQVIASFYGGPDGSPAVVKSRFPLSRRRIIKSRAKHVAVTSCPTTMVAANCYILLTTTYKLV